MPLIELRSLGKDWGLDPIFSGLDLKIEEGEKIGLVGPNGSGKTSLVRILAGLDDDYRGLVVRRPGLRVALVPQRFEPPSGISCVEVLLAEPLRVKARLDLIAEAMAGSEAAMTARMLEEYGELSTRYEELGGDFAEENARRLLERSGLGAAMDAPATSISGGEKNVLALAAALASGPELLLLDEPGNHLDFDGLAWLEAFVREERRAILMVSHNRSLLDRSVGRVLELSGGELRSYAGGYSAYRIEKLSRLAGQGRDWQADRRRVERLEALVRRFAQIAASRPDPAWGKRLRARRSQLEREREAAASRPDLGSRSLSISFSAEESKSDYALVVKDYRKAFGDRLLFEGAGFDLLSGEKAAIVGPNGSGKTSFLRDLVSRAHAEGQDRWDRDESIRIGPSMVVGYCAQEQELFRHDRTVGEEFVALGAKGDEAYKLLKRYAFERPILETRVGALSGGELNRLQIARAVFLGANFLVLDEPTNHLDIESREVLEEALEDFAGTLLVVSHDRWFLDKVAERIILVEDRLFRVYEGGFSEYLRDRGPSRQVAAAGRRSEAGTEGRAEAMARSRAAAGGDASDSAKRASRPSLAARQIEDRITSLEKEKERHERSSAALIEGRDFGAAGRAAEKAKAAGRTLEKLYAEWEKLQ